MYASLGSTKNASQISKEQLNMYLPHSFFFSLKDRNITLFAYFVKEYPLLVKKSLLKLLVKNKILLYA